MSVGNSTSAGGSGGNKLTRSKKRRPGDPWVSKNRVLIGNGGARIKHNVVLGRNPNFDADETKVLIQLWGDPKVQRQLITTHKKYAVIAELSAKMEEYGYFRTPEEITTRIKNLKCIYNRLKKEVDSGEYTESKPSWRHYNEMDAVMSRPIFSVRPNEVPAPSIKFQIEQELERRKERKKKIVEEGGSISESEDEDIIDVLAFTEPRGRCGAFSNTSTMNDNENKQQQQQLQKYRDEKTKLLKNFQCIDSNIGIDKQIDRLNDEELLIKMELETEEFESDRRSSDDCIITKTNNNPCDNDNNKSLNSSIKHTTKNKKVNNYQNKLNISNNDRNSNVISKKHNNKKKNRNDKGSDDDLLLIPKMEPIDVDAEDGSSCDSGVMPVSASCDGTVKNLKTSMDDAVYSNTSAVPATVATTFAGGINRANSSGSNVNANQGKISLVPTNFLMPSNVSGGIPSQPQIRLLPNASGQLQPHLVLNAATAPAAISSNITTNTNNTGIMTTGPGGMKLLLVNAEQTGKSTSNNALTALTVGNKLTTTNLTNSKNNVTYHSQQQQLTMRQIMPQSMVTDESQILQPSLSPFTSTTAQVPLQVNINQARQSNVEEPVNNDGNSSGDTIGSKKDFNGIRLLMGKLLQAQNRINEYQKQRLDVELERFEFERNTAEKFFNLFNQHLQQQLTLQQQVVSLQQQQQQIQQYQEQKNQQLHPTTLTTVATTVIGNTIPTSTGAAGSIRLNSKVFFTTDPSIVVSTGVAASTVIAPNVLTTATSTKTTNFITQNTNTMNNNNANIQVVTSSSSDKMSLQIPKNELNIS